MENNVGAIWPLPLPFGWHIELTFQQRGGNEETSMKRWLIVVNIFQAIVKCRQENWCRLQGAERDEGSIDGSVL